MLKGHQVLFSLKTFQMRECVLSKNVINNHFRRFQFVAGKTTGRILKPSKDAISVKCRPPCTCPKLALRAGPS